MSHTAADFKVINATQDDIAKLNLALAYLDTSFTGNMILNGMASKGTTINMVHDGKDQYDGWQTINWDPDAAHKVSHNGAWGVQSAATAFEHEGAHRTDINYYNYSSDPKVASAMRESYALDKETSFAIEKGEATRDTYGDAQAGYVRTFNSTQHTANYNGTSTWQEQEFDLKTTTGGAYNWLTPPDQAPVIGGVIKVDNATITIADGAIATVKGTGNKFTGGNNAGVTVVQSNGTALEMKSENGVTQVYERKVNSDGSVGAVFAHQTVQGTDLNLQEVQWNDSAATLDIRLTNVDGSLLNTNSSVIDYKVDVATGQETEQWNYQNNGIVLQLDAINGQTQVREHQGSWNGAVIGTQVLQGTDFSVQEVQWYDGATSLNVHLTNADGSLLNNNCSVIDYKVNTANGQETEQWNYQNNGIVLQLDAINGQTQVREHQGTWNGVVVGTQVLQGTDFNVQEVQWYDSTASLDVRLTNFDGHLLNNNASIIDYKVNTATGLETQQWDYLSNGNVAQTNLASDGTYHEYEHAGTWNGSVIQEKWDWLAGGHLYYETKNDLTNVYHETVYNGTTVNSGLAFENYNDTGDGKLHYRDDNANDGWSAGSFGISTSGETNDGSGGSSIPSGTPSCTSGSYMYQISGYHTEYFYDEDGDLSAESVADYTQVWISDPIILNLKGDKVQTTALTGSSTYFDMQNNGQKVQTGWATAGEGILVYDPNNTGSVTHDADLVAGFGALTDLAKTSSGTLDTSNPLWNQLKVWVDNNGDAVCQQGEMQTLDQLGIASINLTSTAEQINSNGNVIFNDSSFSWKDGRIGDIAGIGLAFNPNATNDNHSLSRHVDYNSSSPAKGSLNRLIESMAAFTDGNPGIDANFMSGSVNDQIFHLAATHNVQHA
ncbi:hypothetical protein [Undibacterium sp.]|uniref:hypothetical protein n=1 Tax=Undibacterium sp. TaxID=1914977 RepID=UPI0025EBE950|nr:hypothetical protein [Undibacterium sp.]